MLQGLNYVMPLFVFPYLISTLGSEGWGKIGFSMSVVQYLMIVVDFGFNLTATKRISIAQDNIEQLQKIIWETLWAKLILLALCFVVVVLLAFGIEEFLGYRSTIMVMFLMVVANTFSFVWLFQGMGKIKIASIVNTAMKIAILPLVFVFVKDSGDYLKAAWIQSTVYVMSSVVLVLLILNNGWIKTFFIPKLAKIKDSFRDAFPIFLTMAASSIYTALFVVGLGFVSDEATVGEYSASEKIMRGVAYLVFIPISQYMFPKISVLSEKDVVAGRLMVNRVAKYTLLLAGVLSCGLFFGAELIIRFFGEDYSTSLEVFRIMAFIPVFISVGGMFGQLGLVAAGGDRSKKYFQNVYFVAGGVAVVLIFTAIPYFGLQGAAWSLFFTELLVLVGMYYCFRAKGDGVCR